MISPYWDKGFFEFFAVLLQRAWGVLSGSVSPVADEVQIAVLGLIAIASGLIGPFLVLRQMTLLANSLSHTILAGILVAFIAFGTLDLPTLLLGALIAALATTSLTDFFHRVLRLQEDASIGLVFTSLFAVGIVGMTVFLRDVHLGIETVMGNVDALQKADVHLALLLACVNGSILLALFHPMKLTSFDGNLSQTLGIRAGLYRFILMFLTGATVVGAFRAVGVLLVLAFLVGPYLTMRLFCHKLHWLLFWTPLVGIIASCVGVALARHFLTVFDLPLSTGGIVAVTLGAFYLLAFLARHIMDRFKRARVWSVSSL